MYSAAYVVSHRSVGVMDVYIYIYIYHSRDDPCISHAVRLTDTAAASAAVSQPY